MQRKTCALAFRTWQWGVSRVRTCISRAGWGPQPPLPDSQRSFHVKLPDEERAAHNGGSLQGEQHTKVKVECWNRERAARDRKHRSCRCMCVCVQLLHYSTSNSTSRRQNSLTFRISCALIVLGNSSCATNSNLGCCKTFFFIGRAFNNCAVGWRKEARKQEISRST